MGVRKSYIWIVFIIGVCAIFVFAAHYLRSRIRPIRSTKLLQRRFASEAEELRKGLESSSGWSVEELKRRNKAVELLSNGVFDTQVVLLHAGTDPPYKPTYGHPIGDESPRLVLYAVDELSRIASAYYDDSNEPNAFGEPLFSTRHWYTLFPNDERPKFFWYIPMVCYGEEDSRKLGRRRLTIHGDGLYESFVTLEVTVGEWNSLLANRGQLILRDGNLCELDRIRLRPSGNKKVTEILHGLMLLEE
jgi:hypothetical protein